jgi:hypothetical protein
VRREPVANPNCTLWAARLCDVSLRPRQQIEFPTAGKIILCMEGPRFTPQFRKLGFELRQPGGAEIAGQRILFRAVASGLSHARVTLRTYDLPMAGRFELIVHGLEPRHIDAPEHHELHAHCPRCARWATLPLAEWVSQGKGSLRLPINVRCRHCGAPGRLQVRPPAPTRGPGGWMEPH